MPVCEGQGPFQPVLYSTGESPTLSEADCPRLRVLSRRTSAFAAAALASFVAIWQTQKTPLKISVLPQFPVLRRELYTVPGTGASIAAEDKRADIPGALSRCCHYES